MTELTNEQILDLVRGDEKLLTKIRNEYEKRECGAHQKRDIIPQAVRDKYGHCGQRDEVSKLIRQRIDAEGWTASKRINTKYGYRTTPLYDYSDKQYEIYCWAAELIYDALEQIGKVGETYRDKNGALMDKFGRVLIESWDGGPIE